MRSFKGKEKIVMDDFNATDIIEINETVTVWTRYLDSSSEDKNLNNSTDPEVEAMLPAYIAYTSFVLFRYVQIFVRHVSLIR